MKEAIFASLWEKKLFVTSDNVVGDGGEVLNDVVVIIVVGGVVVVVVVVDGSDVELGNVVGGFVGGHRNVGRCVNVNEVDGNCDDTRCE